MNQIISKIPSSAITYIWDAFGIYKPKIYTSRKYNLSDISSAKHQENFIVHVTTMQGEKKRRETATPISFLVLKYILLECFQD